MFDAGEHERNEFAYVLQVRVVGWIFDLQVGGVSTGCHDWNIERIDTFLHILQSINPKLFKDSETFPTIPE